MHRDPANQQEHLGGMRSEAKRVTVQKHIIWITTAHFHGMEVQGLGDKCPHFGRMVNYGI